MPPPVQPFSKRHGYIGQTKEITIRDDAPKDLRFVFLGITRALAREYCGTIASGSAGRGRICRGRVRPPDPKAPQMTDLTITRKTGA
jgi:hypothetical protein